MTRSAAAAGGMKTDAQLLSDGDWMEHVPSAKAEGTGSWIFLALHVKRHQVRLIQLRLVRGAHYNIQKISGRVRHSARFES